MNRFQIEDIVEQDKHGVVFRARDVESGRIVSLRRFLPFGQDGGGLEKEEAVAYGIAAERLATLSHESLRSVIMGAVDPIDGIPYLVTEWVDGQPLDEILAGKNMDPALVIDVLRIALEVSIVLSEVLGEEAVWVETEVESIVIGTSESGRGFTFWISPFKWLGAQFGSRKLSSIVELGERLTGWKGKAVSDKSGYGLGGWLKWLKRNPDARLGMALEMMGTCIGKETPLPAVVPLAADTGILVAQPSSSGKMRVVIIAAAAALVLVSAVALLLRKTVDQTQGAEDGGAVAAGKTLSAAELASARARELQLEAAGKSAMPAPGETAPDGKPYTADDKGYWADIKSGEPVKLGGILREVKRSSTGKSIYLFFADSADRGKLAGVAHMGSFKGDFREEAFMPLVGKHVVLTGTCFKEPTGRFLAKVSEMAKIEVVK